MARDLGSIIYIYYGNNLSSKTHFLCFWPTIFLRSNGIKHFKSAPYHGAVERLVQTLKNSLKKGKKEGHTSQYTLLNFLLFYRATLHSTTGKPPSEIMIKRPLRTVLDLLYNLIQKLKFIINKVYRRVIMTLIHTVLSTRSRAASHGL